MAEIVAVTPGSKAAKAGFLTGMKIVEVNGRQIADIIDWKQALAFSTMRTSVIHDGKAQSIVVRHRSGEDIGLAFSTSTLDSLRTCKNSCVFCFVKQMPKKQRHTLYVRDDDYRLSLVYGSFVTLTNLDNDDWNRIFAKKISPIYVSVHTTNPNLRAKILGNPNAAHILEQLKELVAHGISVHAQLVLIPGINDELELERSICDLMSLSPGLESIAVVPVGLTMYRDGLPELRGFDKDAARAVLSRISAHQKRCRRKLGRSLVYAADEFYVLAESDFPSTKSYDEYSQLENGVGMSRLFRDDFMAALRAAQFSSEAVEKVVWVTGESSALSMRYLQNAFNARSHGFVDVLAVPNRLFGGGVTVTGLLGGKDIALALGRAFFTAGTSIIIPDVTLRDGLFLDDLPFKKLQSWFPEYNIHLCPTNGADLVRWSLGQKE